VCIDVLCANVVSLTVGQPLSFPVVLQVGLLHWAAVVNGWFSMLQSCYKLSVLVFPGVSFGERVQEGNWSV
jgi:hypothetical protein